MVPLPLLLQEWHAQEANHANSGEIKMRDDENETTTEAASDPVTTTKETKPKRVRKKAATKGAAKKKAKAKTKPKAVAKEKKEVPTGLRGEIVGARTGTAKDLVVIHLVLHAKKQIPLDRLSQEAYPGKKTVNGGALKAVLSGIKGTLKSKKIKWELKSETNEKKEQTVGLYPIR